MIELCACRCIEVTYGSGEWSGVEVASSYVSLGGDIGTNVTYAGITYQDDFFEGGSSYVGILGMAYEGIANSYEVCRTRFFFPFFFSLASSDVILPCALCS
jgi:hypothetical protein